MKIHQRETLVNKAHVKIKEAIVEHTRGLTEAEILRVIAAVLADEIGGIAKYQIRMERHGDPDKPGGQK